MKIQMKFTIIKLRTLKEVLNSNWDSVKIQIGGKVTGLKNNSSHQQIEKNEICGENKQYSQNRTVFQWGSEIVYANT